MAALPYFVVVLAVINHGIFNLTVYKLLANSCNMSPFKITREWKFSIKKSLFPDVNIQEESSRGLPILNDA